MWGKVNTLRQTFLSKGQAGRTTFVTNNDSPADYLLMGMNDDESNDYIVPFKRENRILFIMENPSIWSPSQSTIDSAGIIVTPFSVYNKNAKVVKYHAAIPWFYGISFAKDKGLLHSPLSSSVTLDQLLSMQVPKKNKLLSIRVSGKNNTKGYQWRLSVAQKVKDILGDNCDIFGFGHNPIEDKKDALDPYYFHLCIENEASEHYWTEKLADPLLAFCQPIYSGALHVSSYFDCTVPTIDFGCDPEEACKIILKVISCFDESKYREIYENRQKILLHHNLYYLIDKLLRSQL